MRPWVRHKRGACNGSAVRSALKQPAPLGGWAAGSSPDDVFRDPEVDDPRRAKQQVPGDFPGAENRLAEALGERLTTSCGSVTVHFRYEALPALLARPSFLSDRASACVTSIVVPA